jgi:hypothetical protein
MRLVYVNARRRRDNRDFFRLALHRWTAPAFAALSKAEFNVPSSVFASSFLPASTKSRYLRSNVFKADFALRLREFFRALLRMRRSADFVFGISTLFCFVVLHPTTKPNYLVALGSATHSWLNGSSLFLVVNELLLDLFITQNQLSLVQPDASNAA